MDEKRLQKKMFQIIRQDLYLGNWGVWWINTKKKMFQKKNKKKVLKVSGVDKEVNSEK